jgi:hypothetical protein
MHLEGNGSNCPSPYLDPLYPELRAERVELAEVLSPAPQLDEVRALLKENEAKGWDVIKVFTKVKINCEPCEAE